MVPIEKNPDPTFLLNFYTPSFYLARFRRSPPTVVSNGRRDRSRPRFLVEMLFTAFCLLQCSQLVCRAMQIMEQAACHANKVVINVVWQVFRQSKPTSE